MAVDQNAIPKDLRPFTAAPNAHGNTLAPIPDLLSHAGPLARPTYYPTAVDPLASWPAVGYPRQQALPNGYAEPAAAGAARSDDAVPETAALRSTSSRKVKFLCSFGGKILPRPSDGVLRYVGGHTRIIAFRMDVSFQELAQKMSETHGGPVVMKYQLPDEDLDALVTVSCPEDLENMMEEYDKLSEVPADASAKIRMFLFSPSELDVSCIGVASDVSDTGQRYVDAGNEIGEKEASGIGRKGSLASMSSNQSSDGVPAELLHSTAEGAPSENFPRAVAPPGAALSFESSESACPDVAFDPFFSISSMASRPVMLPGSSGIPSPQTLSSSMLEQTVPPSCGAGYLPPAYMESIQNDFNRVESIRNPGELNPQKVRAAVGYVANLQQSYVAAVHATATTSTAQVSSGKPVLTGLETMLDDVSTGGRNVQVAASPTYKPFQALSQIPPLRPSVIYTQNVERYGLSQVPSVAVTSMQSLRIEDCSKCPRALPHVHSDNLMQEHGGSISCNNPSPRNFHSEEMARSQVPHLVGCGTIPDTAVVHQMESSLCPPLLGAYDYSYTTESHQDTDAVLYDTHTRKNKISHSQVLGFSGPVQPPYGFYLNNQIQAWHGDMLQQPQPPLALQQYLVRQAAAINHPDGTNIAPAMGEISHNPDYIKTFEGMAGAPHPHHFQAGLGEYRVPDSELNSSIPVLTGEAMDALHVSPSVIPRFVEPQKMFGKNDLKDQHDSNDQHELSPESLPSGDIRQQITQITQTDSFETETFVSPTKAEESHETSMSKLVDLLLSSTSGVTCISSLQQGDFKQVSQLPVNFTPYLKDFDQGNEPPMPHERLLQGSGATTRATASDKDKDWKNKVSQPYAGNISTDVLHSGSTLPDSFSSSSTQNVQLGDVPEPSPSESLFSNLEPWQIMHNAHLLPPKPRRVASREMLAQRDSCIDTYPTNSSESSNGALLEGLNYGQHLDSFIERTCLDTSTAYPVEGATEELIKQELQAVAEGVAASVLQHSTHVPELRSGLEKGSFSASEVNKVLLENNTTSHNSACHRNRKDEDIKTDQSNRLNFGFPAIEDIGHLQIIRNSDLEELQELGSGTFGTVYHGKWRGSDVAIKRINDRCFAGKQPEQERLRTDFWNEASKLADLHHPNVVAFYGVVLDGPGGSVATVTEYMVNGSLRQAMQKNHKILDRHKRILIAMDVAFGMEYLHGKNIVHFDLKSDNLLVNLRDPQRPICKVGDLGLSKVKCQTLISGGVRGTLPWMAPELLNGSSSLVSEKVDVFSFGIVMWELLTGDEPYADLHYGTIIGGIVSNTLRPSIPDSCDPEWSSLMEKCWSSEPSERPSFTEIADILRAMPASVTQKAQGQPQASALAPPQK